MNTIASSKNIVFNNNFSILIREDRSDKFYLNDILECQYSPEIGFNDAISFQTIYKEIYQFDSDNNHLQLIKQINGHKKCICNGCKRNKISRNGVATAPRSNEILLCREHRKHLSDNLVESASDRNCITNELRDTALQLQFSNDRLVRNSREIDLKLWYFPIIYGYLTYQKEINSMLFPNLLDNNSKARSEDTELATNTKEIFEFLFLTRIYLEQMMKLLIIFYCCFDNHFNSVFYPFLRQAIPTKLLNYITNNSASANTDEEKTEETKDENACFGIIAFAAAAGDIDPTKLKTQQKRVIKSTQAISIFNELIYDICSGDTNENTGSVANNEDNAGFALKYLFEVESKLNELINYIKSESLVSEIVDVAKDEIKEGTNANDSEIDNNYNIIGVEKYLPEIIVKQMNKIPFGMKKENIYCNYYSTNQIKRVLNEILDEMDINIGIDAISVIASFCNILKWAENQKGKKIDCNIYSKDKSINYAILTEPNNRICNTILVNEWIGNLSEEPNKYIFRYLFKYFGTPTSLNTDFCIGLVGNCCIINCNHGLIGCIPKTIGLSCFAKGKFYYKNRRFGTFNIPIGKGSNDNMYFIMEINLKTRFLAFYGHPMYVIINYVRFLFHLTFFSFSLS